MMKVTAILVDKIAWKVDENHELYHIHYNFF